MTSLTDIIADIHKAMKTVKQPLPDTWSVGKMTVAYIEAVQPSNIAAVLDALERAERERDASKEEASLAWSSDEHQAVWAELKARAEAAEAALKEAVELLKPFAETPYAQQELEGVCEDDHEIGGLMTLGHLRAARRFIEAHTGGEDAE